ncbi:peptidase inhibitor I78, partial [Phenylobacterium sp. CCH12-B4]|uniref:peptidase inhibitor I78 n=1 Tax=Phenylobacterium sp. CCH12-B4 TaxID=1768784 RepID=UPI00083A7F98
PPVAPPPPAAPAPQPVADACRAGDHQYLVGRPRSEIPVPVKPDLQRVACTTCPVTMDFNPNRLNFLFDAQTGLIKEVRCG